ncbi:MAG: uncharacterized protein KVP18_004730 [Porospora cf. gigantea A]|uniref:uncharacterized protein n=1 Tax=Porospora cf. gigantea A TaxID=2853593 RepID=UPI00355A27D6|nr:MAG: hypothetical protein KVP18_004730 [Porospora cf. gigantea A]
MLQVRKDIQEIHNKQEELNLNKKSILQKLEVASKMILRAKHAAPKVKAQHQSLGRTGSSALMSVPQLSAEDCKWIDKSQKYSKIVYVKNPSLCQNRFAVLEIESMSTAPTLAGAVNSLNRISDHHENFLSAHEELMGKFDREMERAITDGEMTEAVDCYVERLAEHQKNLEGVG